ncbi:sigma factor 4 [Tasmannia lanceolata]|uniref:sigma factor 4 n=1 Tax=Tasmannia lanceolata TaxID=3420 RepID=UPI0040630E85
MAISTLANTSPTLPKVSPYAIPSKPSIQTLQTLPSLPFSSSSLISEDFLTISAAAQAVALANAAAQAARDAVSSALAVTEMAFPEKHDFQCENDGISTSYDWKIVSGASKKKRKMGKISKVFNTDCVSRPGRVRRRSSKSTHSRYLTPREEAEFSLYLKEGARLEAAWKNIRELRKHDPSMCEWAEYVGMKKGDLEKKLWRVRESRERIILSYKKLVVSIATPYLGKGLSLQDLVQEGCFGLLQGAERFDSTKGNKLSTYAYWWIKQAIVKAIQNKSRIIKLPARVRNILSQIAEANSALNTRLGRRPTYDEVAGMVGMAVSSVRFASESTRLPLSTDRPMSCHGSITLKEIIPAPEETRPEVMVERQLMKQHIETLLKTLSKREEFILRLQFGLNGETSRSCEEIGKLLNLSRERVRQINCIALEKLRQTSKDLRVYMVL